MKKFYLQLDENNELILMEIDGDEIYYHTDYDLKFMLRKLDRMHVDKLGVSNTSVRLMLSNNREEFRFVIKDIDYLLPKHIDSYLKNTWDSIAHSYKRHQRNKVQHLPKKNILRHVPKVVAGALIVMLLANGKNYFKTNTNDKDDTKSLNDTSIETMIDNSDTLAMNEHNQELLNAIEEAEKAQEIEDMLNELDNVTSNVVYYDYKVENDNVKANYAYDNYSDLVEEYAEKWGISPNIPMCMLTQESGGKEVNLMQITFSAWANEVITVHNFKTGEDVKYMLTTDESKVSTPEITYITPENLKNPKTNISVGCILIRKSAEAMNYHIAATIQCYNFGFGNMNKVLKTTAENTGLSVDELLSDQTNIDFTNYTNIINAGDDEYLRHTIRYIKDTGSEMTIKYLDENNNVQESSVIIMPEEHNKSY